MTGTYGKLMELNQSSQTENVKPQEQLIEEVIPPVVDTAKPKKEPKPRYRDTKQPRHHEAMTPRYRDTTTETVRAAVKIFGKEAATHRFTLEEKKAIRDIVYAYEGRGIRTGENEISRIGVNYLIEDYRQNGENSILHKVLTALNS
jgi:hypothetical protein